MFSFAIYSVVEVGFLQTVYTASEAAGEVLFTIIKSGSNAREVEVTFATEQDTATSETWKNK